MAVTSPTPMRTTREPAWTPRQREVLDLLVRGRTNSQIAESLGISLDGAKWHVSEIITRLGVDSRDEAAEYWRHHNGLRMRFTRIASGLFSSGALKWGLGTAFVAGVVVVSAMVIVALRGTGGDDADRAGNGLDGTATPTPSVPATPPGTPPPNVTPVPAGETIAGVTVGRLSYAKPEGLPLDGLALIVEKGCYQCDGPASAIERVTSEGGQQKVETLFKAASPSSPNGYILSSLFDAASGRFYIAVCSRGYCGGVGQISTDAQTTILQSSDGGITWQSIGTFDGPVTVAFVTQQGPVLNLTTYTNGTPDYKYQLLGASTVSRPPAGTEPAYMADGVVLWQKSRTREILRFDGTPFATLPDVESAYGVRIETVLEDGSLLISWSRQEGQQKYYYYLGLMEGGKLTKVFRSDSYTSVGAGLNGNLVWGNVSVSPHDIDPGNNNDGELLHPMWLDMHTGEVHVLELYGPAFSDAYVAQRNRIREFQPGPFLRVTGAGDCLNVREQPSTSAPVIRCFADNVLLRNLAQEQKADGITWKKVETPTGKQGWASAEFLRGTLSNP